MRWLMALILMAAPAWAQDYTIYPGPGQSMAEEIAAESPEKVVAGLSRDAVGITASFDGSDILIFGAIKREIPVPAGELSVIVTLEGPSQALTIRRKARRMGIWVNVDSVVVGAAPDFYSVSTSGPIDEILDPQVDTIFRISIPLAMRAFARAETVSDATAFTEAMVRKRIEDREYRLDQGAVTIVDDTLFRADVRLPANLVEGDYKTRIFLLRNGNVMDVYHAPITVKKVGLERWLYHMAYEQPFLYGLMSLALAVFAGWAASAAFRALKRN